MSAGPPAVRRPRAIAAVMICVAAAAVAITVPHVVAAQHTQAPAPAPGLAALSDQQLAGLLPTSHEFPPGWTPNRQYTSADTFGYSRRSTTGHRDRYRPADCGAVAYGIYPGAYPSATVDEHDPADRSHSHLPASDIKMEVGREFNPDVFDQMRTLVLQCEHFHASNFGFDFTTSILEDTRPADAPQRFRYTMTVSWGQNPVHRLASDDYAYARFDHLIVSAKATAAHGPLLHQFFTDALRRITTVRVGQ
jgi:hypothetical protein